MARFVIVAFALAVLAYGAWGVTRAVSATARAGRDRVHTDDLGNGFMQKLSFVLLCALIFYVAIWGGA
ncbi:hypothetical protein [Oceaniglobus roseus]|uniref:hypothetical protein n=1 Tax=Oceaniglobus roseus TaxID=1737570 RepID=UPI000C7EDBEC|nr:hypothetical protein [Kandeliimicrobium roseum]